MDKHVEAKLYLSSKNADLYVACALRRMRTELGFDGIRDIAEKIGISESHLSNASRMNRKLSYNHARKLAKLIKLKGAAELLDFGLKDYEKHGDIEVKKRNTVIDAAPVSAYIKFLKAIDASNEGSNELQTLSEKSRVTEDTLLRITQHPKMYSTTAGRLARAAGFKNLDSFIAKGQEIIDDAKREDEFDIERAQNTSVTAPVEEQTTSHGETIPGGKLDDYVNGKYFTKVVFLNLDGVINNNASIAEGIAILPEKCLLVNDIIEATGADILLATEWLRNGDDAADELVRSLHLCGLQGSSVRGAISISGDVISDDIDKWLATDGKDMIKNYVILDVGANILDHHADNAVIIDKRTGLTRNHVKKAVRILKR